MTLTLENTLTPRELDVVEVLAHGASNKQIAKMLKITTGTVTAHIVNVGRKLFVADSECSDRVIICWYWNVKHHRKPKRKRNP